jgi:hypothetical protein
MTIKPSHSGMLGLGGAFLLLSVVNRGLHSQAPVLGNLPSASKSSWRQVRLILC